MIRTTARTARKRRNCERCFHEIKPGDRYLEHVASPGGDLGFLGWARSAECAPCAAMCGRPIAESGAER